VCKKGDCWLTRYTKEERNKVREGLKRRVHQYLIDNNINNDFDKDITAIVFNTLTLTTVSTTTSSNFFYNNYGVKHFITLNGLIPIKTAKNIVTSINNNTFVYGLTGSIEPSGIKPSGTEPSTARRSDVSNKGKSATYFCNNNNNDVNIENLTVNINLLDYYFNDNG